MPSGSEVVGSITELAPALLRTVFDLISIFGPFLAPLEWQAATLTDFRFKPVVRFRRRVRTTSSYSRSGTLASPQ